MNEIEKQHIESLMSKYHEDFKLIGKHPLAEALLLQKSHELRLQGLK